MFEREPIQTDIPCKQLRVLEQKLQIVEEEYRRFAIDECDVDEDTVAAKIKQARSGPQKNKRLQRIREAHMALMKAKLDIAEEEYRRFAIDESDVDEQIVATKIKQARLAPQKNMRLQRIHEAYKALMKANSN